MRWHVSFYKNLTTNTSPRMRVLLAFCAGFIIMSLFISIYNYNIIIKLRTSMKINTSDPLETQDNIRRALGSANKILLEYKGPWYGGGDRMTGPNIVHKRTVITDQIVIRKLAASLKVEEIVGYNMSFFTQNTIIVTVDGKLRFEVYRPIIKATGINRDYFIKLEHTFFDLLEELEKGKEDAK